MRAEICWPVVGARDLQYHPADEIATSIRTKRLVQIVVVQVQARVVAVRGVVDAGEPQVPRIPAVALAIERRAHGNRVADPPAVPLGERLADDHARAIGEPIGALLGRHRILVVDLEERAGSVVIAAIWLRSSW